MAKKDYDGRRGTRTCAINGYFVFRVSYILPILGSSDSFHTLEQDKYRKVFTVDDWRTAALSKPPSASISDLLVLSFCNNLNYCAKCHAYIERQ